MWATIVVCACVAQAGANVAVSPTHADARRAIARRLEQQNIVIARLEDRLAELESEVVRCFGRFSTLQCSNLRTGGPYMQLNF